MSCECIQHSTVTCKLISTCNISHTCFAAASTAQQPDHCCSITAPPTPPPPPNLTLIPAPAQAPLPYLLCLKGAVSSTPSVAYSLQLQMLLLFGCITPQTLMRSKETAFMLLQAAVSGRPGAAYIDIPSNILFGPAHGGSAQNTASSLQIPTLGPNRLLRERPHADGAAVHEAAQLLANAQRYPFSSFMFALGSCMLYGRNMNAVHAVATATAMLLMWTWPSSLLLNLYLVLDRNAGHFLINDPACMLIHMLYCLLHMLDGNSDLNSMLF